MIREEIDRLLSRGLDREANLVSELAEFGLRYLVQNGLEQEQTDALCRGHYERRSEGERPGWTVEFVTDAGFSAKSLRRPGITEALATLKAGGAEALVVSKLDRLSRSMLDFAAVMERSRREGWAVVALDVNVDTTTPSGELIAGVMAQFAHYERRLIGQRTKDALEVKRSQGIRLSRPPVLTDATRVQLVSLRESGLTYQGIADRLNAEGVPTAQGGLRWYPSTVRAVLLGMESVA